jgi:hypothetical protein
MNPPPAKAAKLGARRPNSGEALIAVMQASPHREFALDPARAPMPVRDNQAGEPTIAHPPRCRSNKR